MKRWQEALAPEFEALEMPVDVFFRDDDGGWNDSALYRLVGIFEAAHVPLDIAVIPGALTEPLARWLAVRFGSGLGLHQHGWAHVNHEPVGRKSEFGATRTADLQRRDINCGARRLRDLLRLEPDAVFTPPWNRCREDTARALVELGFQALSRDAGAAPLGGKGALHELPVTLDWMKHRCEEGPDVFELAKRIGSQIAERGQIGIMLHHAVMLPSDFDALESLLLLLGSNPKAKCLPMRALLPNSDSCISA